MSPLEELLSKRWILKSKDVDLYYHIKDSLRDIRKFMREKFGYHIVVNPYLIKLEKIPGKAEPWMGITAFQSIREYQMFCYLLMFLEEKEREQQFVLSDLCEFIQMQFGEGELTWTNLASRRQLIRVIRYSIDASLMNTTDGESERFIQHQDTQVLYENTGISRYFMRNFMREVLDYQTPAQFETSEWIDVDEDRGIVRRQRIYRRLLLSCGVYRESVDDDDFLYIRNYRNQIRADFQSCFPCEIHIHQSSAYLNLSEDCSVGSFFPFHHTMSDLMLILQGELRRRVGKYQLQLQDQEQLHMETQTLFKIAKKCVARQLPCLPKKYRELGSEHVAKELLKQLCHYGFAIANQDESQMIVYPIIAKVNGGYGDISGGNYDNE